MIRLISVMPRFFLACLVLSAGSALAAENVTDKALTASGAVDFTQPLSDARGKPMMQRDDCPPPKPGEPDACPLVPQTLGDIAVTALTSMLTKEDQDQPGNKKFLADRLAHRIYKAKVVLSPEDMALIKERIGKVYGPAVVGATWPLLDPTLRNAIEDAK